MGATGHKVLESPRVFGHYEATHPVNVAALSRAIGQALGLAPKDLDSLVHAALIHDLGQHLVPPQIRYKVGALTPEEVAVMRHHPAHSARIAEQVAGAAVA